MERGDKNLAYLLYLRKHPEVLKNEPTYAPSPATLLKMTRQGLCPPEHPQKSIYKARREWEHFHLKTASALGLEISIPSLHQDKMSNAIEMSHRQTQGREDGG